jgi:hypothetical protein
VAWTVVIVTTFFLGVEVVKVSRTGGDSRKSQSPTSDRGCLAECLCGLLQRAPATRAAQAGILYTLFEAKVLIGDWSLDNNHCRPHVSLGFLTTVQVTLTWRASIDATHHSHQRRGEDWGPVRATKRAEYGY